MAAFLLLIVGCWRRHLGGYEYAQGRAAHTATRATQAVAAAQPPSGRCAAPAEVASISSIVRQPNSEIVEVTLQPAGAAADSGFAGRPGHPPVADAGRQKTQPRPGCATTRSACWRPSAAPATVASASGIRDALMVALRYDKNAGVREKALEGWSPMSPRTCGCATPCWRRC